MEPTNDNSSTESSSFCRDEKVEALDLLEECWYFDNMLKVRPRIPRCHSDPSPSSGLFSPDFLEKDSEISRYSSSTSKQPNKSGSVPPKKIQRAPSMPPLRVKEEDKNGRDFTRSKLVHQSPSRKPQSNSYSVPPKRIQRAPSMPPLIVRDEDEKKGRKGQHRSDCSKRKSKLLRTPSLPSSIRGDEKLFQVNDCPRTGRSPKQPSTPTNVDNMLPPRQPSMSCSIRRSRSVRNSEVESIKTEVAVEMRRRFLNQKTMRRSLSDLEFEEVQGFKDLGFKFEKESLSPSLTNIIPGLKEKNRDETDEDKAARGPYLSEAWLVQTFAPPIPSGASNMSVSDMKQQIKFWARDVASNVYQEC